MARSPAARLAGWEQVSTLDDEETYAGKCPINGSGRPANREASFSPLQLITLGRKSNKLNGKPTVKQTNRTRGKLHPNSSHSLCHSADEATGHNEKATTSEHRVKLKATSTERPEWLTLKKITPIPGPAFAALKSTNDTPGSLLLDSEESVSSAATPTVTLNRIPILGSRQCGKTTLVKQFVYCTGSFNSVETTTGPEYYDPVVTFNDRIYHLRIIDCPSLVGKYPTSSLEEWAEYRGWCLRSAAAFVLVFDVTSEKSFQYIRKLRDEIVAECSDVPVLLVANKVDGVPSVSGPAVIVPTDYRASTLTSCADSMTAIRTARMNIRREIAILIKKQWKGTVLVECSAKYNWHVLHVFKELMKLLENKEQQSHRPTAARAVQNVLRRNNCSVM